MSKQKIYYVYRKDTGEFSGSGTPFYDNDNHGCTEEPCPQYDDEKEMAYWDGSKWEVKFI